ncbi:MAG TPA: hypothetical protein VKU89_08260 [Solirubrobacteraceae bacterium]|nr:hypothetical protein [Solirubrobacteraceae bacterium]
MPLVAAPPLFLASLALTLYAARAFARSLDRLGERVGLSERGIGALSALAADAPEIVSALVALIGGRAGVSVGVLAGASALNLATMLGLSALLAGALVAARAVVLIEALPALLSALLAALLISGLLSAGVAAALAAAALLAYLSVAVRRGTPDASEHERDRLRRRAWRQGGALRGELIAICATLAGIIAGATGMVEGALALGARLQISGAVIATCLLAPLASLPNALTGLRLGLAGRGQALVGETFHSNAINLLIGVTMPALVVSLSGLAERTQAALWYLAAESGICALLLMRRCGLRRGGGLLVLVLYAGFLAVAL